MAAPNGNGGNQQQLAAAAARTASGARRKKLVTGGNENGNVCVASGTKPLLRQDLPGLASAAAASVQAPPRAA